MTSNSQSIVILDGARRTPRADILINNREPGLFARFATTDDPHITSGMTVDHAYGWAWFGWEEGVITVRSETLLVDEVEWDRRFPVNMGISTTLDPTLLDAVSNDSSSSWCDGKTAYGRGDLGTPGDPNDAC